MTVDGKFETAGSTQEDLTLRLGSSSVEFDFTVTLCRMSCGKGTTRVGVRGTRPRNACADFSHQTSRDLGIKPLCPQSHVHRSISGDSRSVDHVPLNTINNLRDAFLYLCRAVRAVLRRTLSFSTLRRSVSDELRRRFCGHSPLQREAWGRVDRCRVALLPSYVCLLAHELF